MKKSFDSAFCDKILEKKLIKSVQIEQTKNKKPLVSIREALLLDKLISLQNYIAVLAMLQSEKDLIDTQTSLDFDDMFVNYVMNNNLVSAKDLETCRRYQAVVPFRLRELLLANSLITLERYSQIMLSLLTSQDNSEQTLIDGTMEKPIETPDKAGKTGLSFVKDNSAETIIDISHLDTLNNEEEPKIRKVDESEETLIDRGFEEQNNFNDVTVTNNSLNEATIDFNPEEHLEETADEIKTVDSGDVEIDHTPTPVGMQVDPKNEDEQETYPKAETQRYQDAIQEKIRTAISPIQPEPLPTQPISQPISQPIVTTINTAPKIVRNVTSSFDKNIKPPSLPPINNNYVTASSSELPVVNTAQTPQVNNIIADELNAVMMERLVQQVQSQVYMQTQQISQNVGKEISGYKSFYKIIAGMVIFFSMFLLAFTGWIEFQRFQDLKSLRDEKQVAVVQKDEIQQKINDFQKENFELQLKFSKLESKQEIFEQQKQDMDKQKKAWEDKITEISKQNTDLEKILENFRTIATALQNLEFAHSYLTLGDSSKAQEQYTLAKNSWNKLIKNDTYDEMLGLKLSDYLLKNKTPSKEKEAIEILVSLPSSWMAQWKLGLLYYQQSPIKTDLVRKYWGKALELNPNLTKVRDQLKTIK